MTILHLATCAAWESGDAANCNCRPDPEWLIRRVHAGRFPWQIYRWTDDRAYEPLVRCSTYRGALTLVASLEWFNPFELRRESNV